MYDSKIFTTQIGKEFSIILFMILASKQTNKKIILCEEY